MERVKCAGCGRVVAEDESRPFPDGTVVAVCTDSQIQEKILRVWCSRKCFDPGLHVVSDGPLDG